MSIRLHAVLASALSALTCAASAVPANATVLVVWNVGGDLECDGNQPAPTGSGNMTESKAMTSCPAVSSFGRALPQARQLARRAIVGGLLACAGLAVAQASPAVVEVQAGDTFSGIASHFTGSTASWHKLYRSDRSGLADPNRITIGMRFEVATDAGGAQYLRLLAKEFFDSRGAPGVEGPGCRRVRMDRALPACSDDLFGRGPPDAVAARRAIAPAVTG